MSKIEEGSKQQAKKAAKKAAKPAKKQQPTEKDGKKAEAKTSKLNDGMCCRCAWRSGKACKNPKSPKNCQFVARKCSCGQFKHDV